MRPTAWSISPLDSVGGGRFATSFMLPIFFPILSVCKWQWKKDSGLFPFPNFGALGKNNFFSAWRPSACFLPISLVPHSFLFEEVDWKPSTWRHISVLAFWQTQVHSLKTPPCISSVLTQQQRFTTRSKLPSLLESSSMSKKDFPLKTQKHNLWSEEEWFKVLEPALEL